MTPQSMNRQSILFIILSAILITLAGPAWSAEPQPLTSGTITGAGGQSADYVFQAQAGEVTATAEALFPADAIDARLTIELLDGSAESLANAMVGEATGRARDRVEEALRRTVADLLSDVTAPPPVRKRSRVRVTLEEAEMLTLRVRAGKGVTSFIVRLQGPIAFGDAQPASVESEPVAPGLPDALPVVEAGDDTATSDTGGTESGDAAAPAEPEVVAGDLPKPVKPVVRIPGPKKSVVLPKPTPKEVPSSKVLIPTPKKTVVPAIRKIERSSR